MNDYYVVAEIHENKLLQAIICENEEIADKTFRSLVLEYGIEPYDEMIEEGIFEAEDGYTVQVKKMSEGKA